MGGFNFVYCFIIILFCHSLNKMVVKRPVQPVTPISPVIADKKRKVSTGKIVSYTSHNSVGSLCMVPAITDHVVAK